MKLKRGERSDLTGAKIDVLSILFWNRRETDEWVSLELLTNEGWHLGLDAELIYRSLLSLAGDQLIEVLNDSICLSVAGVAHTQFLHRHDRLARPNPGGAARD